MTDADETADLRKLLIATFRAMAAARVLADARDMPAAESLAKIADSIDALPADMLAKLAAVNTTSDGALSQLIALRMREVGFMLPLYDDACSFFQPISDQVDGIIARARPGMH